MALLDYSILNGCSVLVNTAWYFTEMCADITKYGMAFLLLSILEWLFFVTFLLFFHCTYLPLLCWKLKVKSGQQVISQKKLLIFGLQWLHYFFVTPTFPLHIFAVYSIIVLSSYLQQRCWKALSRLEVIIHSMYPSMYTLVVQ